MNGPGLSPSRMHLADVLRTAGVGLRTRKLRAALSALGIMIGIASIVAVLGLSQSSKSDLLTQLDRLGTNMLVVQAGEGIGLGDAALPDTARAMIGRIGAVQEVSAVGSADANVYRNDLVPSSQSGGISVKAVDTSLLATLQGSLAAGRFVDAGVGSYPAVVLGVLASPAWRTAPWCGSATNGSRS
jgi:putative ABC transport system permease protein